MAGKVEYVTHEPGDEDSWVCICGNTTSGDGFAPVDPHDHEVEPTDDAWKTRQLACRTCGRVINRDTLAVVRKVDIVSIVWMA
ncbi:hypothetical protein [Kutzneria sp. NPDC051319]|uniref:hypothetical protein n=1 Tax=Kutzneria sp. NPDC051319 TaxID=3155047 RepID=UPI00343CD7C7